MTNEPATERFRLFVAITLPDAVREEVLRVQRELEPLAPRGVVHWAKPEQFHLTLRFLGDVASHQVTKLQESLRAACAGAPALQLRAQGVGFFPNARSPSVIWVGVNDGENRLAILQQKIEIAVQSYTAGQREERFAGHVTLGRFKLYKHFNISGLAGYAESVKKQVFGRWMAQEIEIVRSELLATGSRYTSMATIRLGTEVASM